MVALTPWRGNPSGRPTAPSSWFHRQLVGVSSPHDKHPVLLFRVGHRRAFLLAPDKSPSVYRPFRHRSKLRTENTQPVRGSAKCPSPRQQSRFLREIPTAALAAAEFLQARSGSAINTDTRGRAYDRIVSRFLVWCQDRNLDLRHTATTLAGNANIAPFGFSRVCRMSRLMPAYDFRRRFTERLSHSHGKHAFPVNLKLLSIPIRDAGN